MFREVLPLFCMPVTVVMVLLLAGLWSKRRWPIAAAAALLWIAATPAISNCLTRAVEGWRDRLPVDAMPTADAIVVLSSGMHSPPGDSSVVEFGEFNRFLGGFDLFRAGKAPRLVFTGGWSMWLPDAPLVGDALASRAREFGVPGAAVSTTGKVANTEQEAAAVAALLRDAARTNNAAAATSPRILLVTSARHMRRAESLFRGEGMDVVPFPVDFSASDRVTLRSFIPCGSALQQTDAVLHELLGTLYDQVIR